MHCRESLVVWGNETDFTCGVTALVDLGTHCLGTRKTKPRSKSGSSTSGTPDSHTTAVSGRQWDCLPVKGRRARDDLNQLVGDGCLAGTVVQQGELLQHL